MRGIRQQHENAMTGRVSGEGGRVGAFGVREFAGVNGDRRVMDPHPAAPYAVLPDGERGIGAPIHRGAGHLPAQAHPDHGPHHHGVEQRHRGRRHG